MRFKYTEAQVNFIALTYKTLRIPEVTAAFNKEFSEDKTEDQIRSAISNHNIRCGRKVGSPKGVLKIFTETQAEFIEKNYKLHQAKQVAALLNETCQGTFTEAQIISFVTRNGITCGRESHFQKGRKPWNTGTKGVIKPNKGNFQKGHRPVNHLPVGSEHLTKDGYRSVKTAEPNQWELLQRYNWAKAHGPENMPENLRFKDGNKLNCEASNLEPVSNQEHMVLNMMGFNKIPNEIKPIILNIAKIDVKIKSLSKDVVA